MRQTIIISACLAFMAYAITRRSKQGFEHLNGWQTLFGLIAVILAVLILINPDLLALGLLGDTSFFDVLVMVLSLQMIVVAQWAWHSFRTALVSGVRWVGVPRGLLRLLDISTFVIMVMIYLVQKVVHRIPSRA